MTKHKFTGCYRLGLTSIFVPDSSLFQTNQKSLYPDVTEQELNFVGNLAEQQKNQRAIKLKNQCLQQTQENKLAEYFTPMTEKLEKLDDSTQK